MSSSSCKGGSIHYTNMTKFSIFASLPNFYRHKWGSNPSNDNVMASVVAILCSRKTNDIVADNDDNYYLTRYIGFFHCWRNTCIRKQDIFKAISIFSSGYRRNKENKSCELEPMCMINPSTWQMTTWGKTLKLSKEWQRIHQHKERVVFLVISFLTQVLWYGDRR